MFENWWILQFEIYKIGEFLSLKSLLSWYSEVWNLIIGEFPGLEFLKIWYSEIGNP